MEKKYTVDISEEEMWAIYQAYDYFKNQYYQSCNKKVNPNLKPLLAQEQKTEIEIEKQYLLKVHSKLRNLLRD